MKILVKIASTGRLTLACTIINVIIFSYFFESTKNPLSLLSIGANFGPFSLGDEPWRLLFSMFLHASILHLFLNMYNLVFLGVQIEAEKGHWFILELYLFSGIVGSICSAYFNLFTISVGASGAIFGLYGYHLLHLLSDKKIKNKSSILVNFLVFLVLTIIWGNKLNLDNYAHFGGLLAGVLFWVLDRYFYFNYRWLLYPFTILIFTVLPRYQKEYFDAFQYFVQKDSSINNLYQKNLTDEMLVVMLDSLENAVDSIKYRFQTIKYIPEKLWDDTSRIIKYSHWTKQDIGYKRKAIVKKSFIYKDSMEYAHNQINSTFQFDYPLIMEIPETNAQKKVNSYNRYPQTVYYDDQWLPTDKLNMSYYRIGVKDSLGQWNGVVHDFYKNGAIQMKGVYSHGLRNGPFIFYNPDSTYDAAGAFIDDNEVGKWEYFYSRNRLSSEQLVTDEGKLILNIYDTAGNILIEDGNGTTEEYYADGTLKFKRTLVDGLNEGEVVSFYPDGNVRFREFYRRGILIEGISYDETGNTYTYDFGTYVPYPEGGVASFLKYIEANNKLQDKGDDGFVILRFTVLDDGKLTDFRYLKSMGAPYDEAAKTLIIDGPKWHPAKAFGISPATTDTEVRIDF